MNYDAAKFWMELAMFLFNIGLWFYVWRSNNDKATNNKINEIEARVIEHVQDNSKQLARIEVRLDNAVGHPELRPIYERLNGVSEQISEINGKMHTLDLIHEMLLNGGVK